MTQRRQALVHLAAIAATAAHGSARAQADWPKSPVRLIVPYPPGGATDAISRTLATRLAENTGLRFVVENKPGASGILGAEALSKSPADGATLMLGINTHVINPLIVPKLPYDAKRDFAPVASFAASEFLLAVQPSLPVHNLQEFIAQAKARPGALNYGTVGSAGIGRIAGELLANAAGIEVQHVPYKGSGPLLTDLLGGQVQFVCDTPNVYLAHIQARKVRPLAVTGRTRLPSLPDVPTFAEAGLPEFGVRIWFGIFVPGATPAPLVQRWSQEIERALQAPEVKAWLASQEFKPYFQDPAAFTGFMQQEQDRYARIIKLRNITNG